MKICKLPQNRGPKIFETPFVLNDNVEGKQTVELTCVYVGSTRDGGLSAGQLWHAGAALLAKDALETYSLFFVSLFFW